MVMVNTKKMNHGRRREIENIMKGVANHRRIQILDFLKDNSGASIMNISEGLSVDFKTISHHARRLFQSGLVTKECESRAVHHTLTRLGNDILTFVRMLE